MHPHRTHPQSRSVSLSSLIGWFEVCACVCVCVWGGGVGGWRRDLEVYTVITKLEWTARPCAHTWGTIAGLMLFVCPSISVQRVKIAVIRCCVLQVLYKQRVKIAMISFFSPFVSFFSLSVYCQSLHRHRYRSGLIIRFRFLPSCTEMWCVCVCV